jgi:hypothetical protein
MDNFQNNDRVQEIFLVLGDKLSEVSKFWWTALLVVLVGFIPLYLLTKTIFVQVFFSKYEPPKLTFSQEALSPLTVLDQKVFQIGPNTYAGYVRIQNLNLDWGVANQTYTADFTTLGGTEVTKINGSTFISAGAEKIIVFSKFTSDQKPDSITFSLGPTNFVHKPSLGFTFDLQRQNIQDNLNGLLVYATIVNTTSFTVKQIGLPTLVYNDQNQIVAAGYTYVSDVTSGEGRAFQITWPKGVDGAVRAEISPEVNVFDRNIFVNAAGVSPFANQP